MNLGVFDAPLSRGAGIGDTLPPQPFTTRGPNNAVSTSQGKFGRVVHVSIASSSESAPGLLVVTPDEALNHARPLPDVETMALGDVPDDEWDALMAALADK